MHEGTVVTSERIGSDVWLIRLTGDNDTQTTPRIRHALVEALRDGGTVMVDLSAATSIDRQVIATIVAAQLDTERLEEGRLLVVAPPGTSCRRSLDLAHADTVLNMLDTRDAALASIMA